MRGQRASALRLTAPVWLVEAGGAAQGGVGRAGLGAEAPEVP